MHELGIVFHIIRTVEDVARQNDVTRIRRVTLQLGEVSGVVEACYGYHIILRLADDADRTVSYANAGATAYSARYLAASSNYFAEVESYVEALDVKYAEGFEGNITDFVK